jgi:AbrB family looped-hinge helix DNA binding protein
MAPPGFEDAFQGSVTVGERGQVVIPATAREQRGIVPGDKLLVFCHPDGCGIVLAKLQDVQRLNELLGPVLQAAEGAGAGEEHAAEVEK